MVCKVRRPSPRRNSCDPLLDSSRSMASSRLAEGEDHATLSMEAKISSRRPRASHPRLDERCYGPQTYVALLQAQVRVQRWMHSTKATNVSRGGRAQENCSSMKSDQQDIASTSPCHHLCGTCYCCKRSEATVMNGYRMNSITDNPGRTTTTSQCR